MTVSILDRFEHWTDKHPDKLLYSFLDLGGNPIESYSYQAFIQRTRLLAAHFRRRYRFRANDRVILSYSPGLEMICAFFACASCGLIPVPTYPPRGHAFREALRKLAFIAIDCQARAVLTSKDDIRFLRTRLAAGTAAGSPLEALGIPHLDWIATDAPLEGGVEHSPSCTGSILFLQYTSGSTDKPKGVMISHENVLHNCSLVADHSSPVAVSWLPQYHDMGLIGYYLFTGLTGGTNYGFSPFDFVQRPSLWLDAISEYRATATSAPNFAFDHCLRSGRISEETIDRTDLSSIRILMAAAEPIQPITYLDFLRRFEPCGLNPKHFFVAYGLAENTLAVSSYGRRILSINGDSLCVRKAKVTTTVSEIAVARQLISCGRPLGDIVVKIVDPESRLILSEGSIGEIWVAGKSKGMGYWNQPERTRDVFRARPLGECETGDGFLRTGDLGFMHEGELYVCSRLKDMLIIRGKNYFPQDIENLVEETSPLIRRGGVVAFEIDDEESSTPVVIAEVVRPTKLPDPGEIADAILIHLNLKVGIIAFVSRKSLPRTSSGKHMRHAAKRIWLNGELHVLARFCPHSDPKSLAGDDARTSPFELLKRRYGLSGNESYSLSEAGVGSIDLVMFLHRIKESLKETGVGQLADEIDINSIQHATIAEIFALAEQLEAYSSDGLARFRGTLKQESEDQCQRIAARMRQDRSLNLRLSIPARSARDATEKGILLTGATGFFGPFLLERLLRLTKDLIFVLVRARDVPHAKERLRNTLASSRPHSAEIDESHFDERVVPVCGDLERKRLGLTAERWEFLADNVHAIYHNGAAVNYLLPYQGMRSANVLGTIEALRLACQAAPKEFNYVSTTFIHGWATKEVLFEEDANDGMELLDFGYSQSKWVAEQLVREAARQGLVTRIFRPALLSPSVAGDGLHADISIRLLAFMVNHGIGVVARNQVSLLPADVAAHNIVAISNSPHTADATYHVTRDEYARMKDITDVITRIARREFKLFGLSAFVPEVIRRCTRNDPLFPLLDFLIDSVDRIASMEFKRYDSSNFQRAKARLQEAIADPPLEDTVAGILRFMNRKGLILGARPNQPGEFLPSARKALS